MLSNLVNQLREMDALDKLDQVYEELPRVRKELGQVPLVTPTSQIVGIQTVNNVLFDQGGERYKMITAQVKDLCYGLYGKTAVPIDPEVQKKALKGYPRGEEPIDCRPADVLEPELEKVRADVDGLARDMDDALIAALYPVTGKRFLRWKYGKEEPPAEVLPRTLEEARAEEELIRKARAGQLVEKMPEKAAPARVPGEGARTFHVFVEGEHFEVEVEDASGARTPPPVKAAPQGTRPVLANPGVSPAGQSAPPSTPPEPPRHAPPPTQAPAPAAPGLAAAAPRAGKGTEVRAPMPGLIVNFEKNPGDAVNEGDTVVVLEAMKMENAIPAPVGGTVLEIRCQVGGKVARDDVLFVVG
jgi:pyruvate carboxylase subunit B